MVDKKVYPDGFSVGVYLFMLEMQHGIAYGKQGIAVCEGAIMCVSLKALLLVGVFELDLILCTVHKIVREERICYRHTQYDEIEPRDG